MVWIFANKFFFRTLCSFYLFIFFFGHTLFIIFFLHAPERIFFFRFAPRPPPDD